MKSQITRSTYMNILLVDDDEMMIKLMETILNRMGYYNITSFTNSNDALVFFQKNSDDVDLVITDMTMPELSGLKLAETILIIRPDMPIILCTGYSEQVNKQQAISKGIKKFFQKPITLITFRTAILELINELD